MGYGHDEINVIVKGKNYGWPKVVGDSSDDSYVNQLFIAVNKRGHQVEWCFTIQIKFLV